MTPDGRRPAGNRDTISKPSPGDQEPELQGDRRRFQTLLGNLPGMVYRCANDQDWTMEYISEGCHAVTGYRPDELMASRTRDYASLIHPDDRDRVWQEVQWSIGARRHFEFEYRLLHRDGSVRNVWERGLPIFGEDGELEALEGFITDMSSREREQRLHRDQARFLQELMDAIPLAVFYKGLDGKYLGCNQEYARFLGVQAKELIGKNVLDIQPEGHALAQDTADRKLFAEPGRQTYESKMIDARGQERDVVVAKATFQDARGRTSGLIGVMTDVTDRNRDEAERRELELQLRQHQKSEALGTLAGGIAHDFNNLLMSMLGFTELALEDAPQNSEQQKNLQDVLHSGERARKLVDQILSFSRQQGVGMEPIELSPIFSESMEMLRSLLPTSIELTWQDEIGETRVESDGNQLQQILVNLATNASHAAPVAGGRIHIELTLRRFDSRDLEQDPQRRAGDFVHLSVRDNGAGIDDGIRERIFDPYFTTKKQGKGTGLGLSVVQGIVQRHGGWIELECPAEGGCCFHVFLPVTRARHPEPAPPTAPQRLRGRGRILVLDDEQAIARLEARELQLLGYEVLSLTVPSEAIAELEENAADYDLLITDMTMPGMTGDEVARRAKAIRPDLPVILCTGYSERLAELDETEMLHAVLHKPVPLETLSQAVHDAIPAKDQ